MSNLGPPDNRAAAGILSFLLNPLGIHGFLLTTKSDQYFPGSAKSAQAIRITSIIVWALIVCIIIGIIVVATLAARKEPKDEKTETGFGVFAILALVIFHIVMFVNFIQTMVFCFKGNS